MMPSSPERPSLLNARRFDCLRHDVGERVVRLALTGELDAAAAAMLEQVLQRVNAERALAVLDLDELTAIDPAGARALCEAASLARCQGRRMIAVNARPAVQSSLRLMGVAREIKLVDPPPTTPSPAAAISLSG